MQWIKHQEGVSMKAVRLCVVLCGALLLVACGLKQSWDLIGKWQNAETHDVMEFVGDGTVKLTSGSQVSTAKYTVDKGGQLVISYGNLGSMSVKMAVNNNTLILTDAQGKANTFKKTR